MNAGAPGRAARPWLDKPHAVRLIRDLVYGQGRVDVGDPARTRWRELRLDLYEPADDPGSGPRPALLMAFGGAFHRGSKEDDAVADGEHRNTSVAQYCHEFARRGYLACAIDYRLVQEDPDPGSTPVVASAETIQRARIDVVRTILGLPPADARMLWQGIEAASDDMACAFRFVQAHAARWRVDPARIAIGGFSAGARTALNAAYGEGVAAAAVVALSGHLDPADLARHLTPNRQRPPVLLISGEHDLDYVRLQAPIMAHQFAAAGVACERLAVGQAGHFYPAQALAGAADGPCCSVEEAIARFLHRRLQGPGSDPSAAATPA